MKRLSLILCPLILVLSGCTLPGQPRPEDRPVPANEISSFDKLYELNCSGCHGAQGNLGPAPPLNDPVFLTIMPRKEIEQILTHGRLGTLMPAFASTQGGSLTLQQIEILADGLKKKWKSDQGTGPFPEYELPKEKGDATAGARVFARACGGCHGTDGRGDKSGKIHDGDYLSLMSDQVLRRLVITGRPDLGMPDYAGKKGRIEDFKPLSNTDIMNLSALLAAWRQESRIK